MRRRVDSRPVTEVIGWTLMLLFIGGLISLGFSQALWIVCIIIASAGGLILFTLLLERREAD